MKDEYIINDYQNGKSLRQIAKEYHVSRNRISKILKEKNIEIRYSNITSKRYFCDENFFEKIMKIQEEHTDYHLMEQKNF